MAVGTTFKQKCPTCDGMVLIKDASLVGKKIECTNCKDTFVVQYPAKSGPAKSADDSDSGLGLAAPARAQGKPGQQTPVNERSSPPAARSPGKAGSEAKPAAKAKSKETKPAETQAKAEALAADAAPPADPGASAATAAASGAPKRNRLLIGIALAGVGVVVLGVAAYFMFGGATNSNKKVAQNQKKQQRVIPPPPPIPGTSLPDPPTPQTPSGEEEKKELKGEDQPPEPAPETKEEKVATEDIPEEDIPEDMQHVTHDDLVRLSNCLPNDTEHVFRIQFHNLFAPTSPWLAPLTAKGALDDARNTSRLGFSILGLEDFIRAERYTGTPWSLSIVHFKKPVSETKLTKTLKLRSAVPIKNQRYFLVGDNAVLEALGRLSLGVPISQRGGAARAPDRTFLHIVDRKTLMIGSEKPIVDFLKAEGKVPVYPTKKAKGPNVVFRTESYQTIHPSLKTTLQKAEAKFVEERDKVLFSSATNIEASKVQEATESLGQVQRRPRQLWDLSLVLNEAKPRIQVLGTALLMKDAKNYVYRTEMTCTSDSDAHDIQKELLERTGPMVSSWLALQTKHGIEPKAIKPGVISEVDPGDDPPGSQFVVAVKGAALACRLDLVLEPLTLKRLQDLSTILATGVQAELNAVPDEPLRHQFARGLQMTAQNGIPARNLPAGTFPPGAFPRSDNASRYMREPAHRVSWMASVLPYVGYETIYSKIQFDVPWHDPTNSLLGRLLVAPFTDPSYPEATKWVQPGNTPTEYGATHFVGIAGVGLDAASYTFDDPAVVARRGVFSYDRSATLAEVQAGRGTANTAAIIQVPHDGLAGLSPWIAGGGATVRGVPEKNSIAPFVLTTDRNNKTINYEGKRGTYVMMVDGSVRFVDQKVTDDVFKAMCTINGPAPADFNLKTLATVPLVPDPHAKPPARTPAKVPAKPKPEEAGGSPEPKDKQVPAPDPAQEKKPDSTSRMPHEPQPEARCQYLRGPGPRVEPPLLAAERRLA